MIHRTETATTSEIRVAYNNGTGFEAPELVFTFPARLITGWAMGRARHHEQMRWAPIRWFSRMAAIPVVISYAFIVYLTQYTSWEGTWSLIAQHAFLTPVPFLSL